MNDIHALDAGALFRSRDLGHCRCATEPESSDQSELDSDFDGRKAMVDSRNSTRDARLTELVANHFDFVWRLLRRMGLERALADDVTQDVFLIAVRRLDAIDVGSERTFLYGAALRAAANALRGRRRRRETPDEGALNLLPAQGALPDERTELVQKVALLDQLLQLLSPELARVLVLAEIAELEGAEIAKLEQIPVGTAASRLRRARKLFREHLVRMTGAAPLRKDES